MLLGSLVKYRPGHMYVSDFYNDSLQFPRRTTAHIRASDRYEMPQKPSGIAKRI